jgi:hypothetical protein
VATRIKIARSAQDLDRLFQARHQALVEERGCRFPQPDLRLVERFDAFPSTLNIIAEVDGEVVGGVRLGAPGDQAPPLACYDFSTHLPRSGRAGTVSAFHLLEAHQAGGQRLGFSMLYMAAFCAHQQQLSHLLCCLEPKVARLAQSIGFQQVAPRFDGGPAEGELVPMLLDLRQLDLPLLRLAEQPGVLSAFQEVEWQFFQAGDAIIQAGTPGEAAYLVVDGEVIVTVERGGPGGPSTFELATLGPGQLFGELALLTQRTRTADVVAATAVDLVVLDREAFRQALARHPERIPVVLEQLAERLARADDLLSR